MQWWNLINKLVGYKARESSSEHTSVALEDVITQVEIPDTKNADDVQSVNGIDLTPVLHVIGSRSENQHKTKAHPNESATLDVQLYTPHISDTGVTDSTDTVSDEPKSTDLQLNGSKSAQQEVDHVNQFSADTKTKHTVNREVQNISTNSRALILKSLPIESDFNLVQSMIHGGAIESMEVNSDQRRAIVKFINSTDCENYIASYPSGIKVKQNGKLYMVHAELSAEPDDRDNVTQAYIDCGATRVVKVDGAKESMTMAALYELAEGSSISRAVEAIVDSYRRGTRSIMFRFANIKDAVSFRVLLSNDRQWKDKVVQFVNDPCEGANGIALQ